MVHFAPALYTFQPRNKPVPRRGRPVYRSVLDTTNREQLTKLWIIQLAPICSIVILSLQTLNISEDRGNGERAPVALEVHKTILACDVALDLEFVPFRMTDIVNRNIVMLAPEERNGSNSSRCPSMLSAAVRPCRSATTQCSTQNVLASVAIGPARDIAGREDPGMFGLPDESSRRSRDRWRDRPFPRVRSAVAPTPTTTIRLEHATASQRYPFLVDGVRNISKMKNDTMLLVERARESPI